MIEQVLDTLKPLSAMLILTICGAINMLMATVKPHRSLTKIEEKEIDENAWPFLSVSLVGLLLALFCLYLSAPQSSSLFYGQMLFDQFSILGHSLVIVMAIFALLIASSYLSEQSIVRGEYYALLLFSVVGMMALISSTELLVFFISLEILSLAIYVMVGFRRADRFSQEAAIKYFLSGAFASAVFLFGAALIFGAVGSSKYQDISLFVQKSQHQLPSLFLVGLAMCLAGFAFKVAAVPFHMWAPDVYQGAPTSVTAWMAASVKATAILALIRFSVMVGGDGKQSLHPSILHIVELLALVTMVVGNLLAVLQSHIKRLLAYSSIANAGYLLVGVLAVLEGNRSALNYVLFYLLIYTFSTMGIFAILIAFERKGGRQDEALMSRYAGLGFKHPILGLALAVFMLTLAGIPPTAGFLGKVLLFTPVLKSGHLALVIVGFLSSVIGVYYYLRVIVWFFMKPMSKHSTQSLAEPVMSKVTVPAYFVLFICMVLVLVVGVLPQSWLLRFYLG